VTIAHPGRTESDGGPAAAGSSGEPEALLTDGLAEFMMVYKFGLDEISTKLTILREELSYRGTGSPIEHVSPRLKTPASITAKARRIGCPLVFDDLRSRIRDIAGIRVVCGFISDVYTVADMLTRQPDVRLLQVKDYVAEPKPNGYRSLHLIVEIPVFLSDRVEAVPVEVQLRTVAMDFWASLEHKLSYKYDDDIPARLHDEMRLDQRMELLQQEIRGTAPRTTAPVPVAR
jgi:putative GTP pyrophosphokinase